MKSWTRVMRGCAVVAVLGLCVSGLAEARNEHCAGGIQYVVQGMRDKDKGNAEDYLREMNKGVVQLQTCAEEDPNDVEALGYLGWAFAELDSAGPAGQAFQKAIQGLEAKGDKKKVEWAINNRNSYWARAFNDGISKVQSAQAAYPDYCKQPENDADRTLRGEAEKYYQAALTSLTRANLLRPNDPQTIRNLGTVYLLMCDFTSAETVLREGLKAAPDDTTLQRALKTARMNYANQMVEQKKYDEAIGFYTELLKAEPENGDAHAALGDVYFRRAQTVEGDARKADFGKSGEAYAKASALKPDEADLAFNSALGYQNGQLWEKAEAQWRRVIKIHPDDVDALSSLGSVLTELKKCDEAIKLVHSAVLLKPETKTLHRQLGGIYGKCGSNAKSNEELMVFLAMDRGKPVADAAAQAKTAKEGSAAAKTFTAEGSPEQISLWDAEGQRYETWFYWSKKLALTFNDGALITRSDWSTTTAAAPAGGKK